MPGFVCVDAWLQKRNILLRYQLLQSCEHSVCEYQAGEWGGFFHQTGNYHDDYDNHSNDDDDYDNHSYHSNNDDNDNDHDDNNDDNDHHDNNDDNDHHDDNNDDCPMRGRRGSLPGFGLRVDV